MWEWPSADRAVVLVSILICLRTLVANTWVSWVYSSVSEGLARNSVTEWLSIKDIE